MLSRHLDGSSVKDLAGLVRAAARRSRATAMRAATAVAFAAAALPVLTQPNLLRAVAALAVLIASFVLSIAVLVRREPVPELAGLAGGDKVSLAARIAVMELLALAYLAALDGFDTALAAVVLIPVAYAGSRGTGLDASVTTVISATVVAVGAFALAGGQPAVLATTAVTFAGLLVALTAGALRQAAIDFSALYETGKALSASLRQEELLSLLLDIAMTDLAADLGMVFLLDRETDRCELMASRGAPPGYAPTSRDVDRSLCDWAVRHRGPCVKTRDLADDPLLAAAGRTSGTAAAIPLVSGSGTVGVILVATRARSAFTEENIRFLEALAAQAATALENAMLYRQTAYWAIRDGLTGLYNYRHFAERLEIELARAARYQKPLSLLVIDVDLFKQVNDAFGHLVGDEVLRSLAERLGAHTRDSDLLARYGGEEFAVVLPETDYEEAIRVAEKLRQAVADTPVAMVGPDATPVSITISIGVATFPATAQAEHIVSQADQALYYAKSRRDCVCSIRGGVACQRGGADAAVPG